MDAIATLIERLENRPELDWQNGGQWLRIASPVSNGFAVELRCNGDEWTVYLADGGWHEHFEDGEEALNFIAWCYSGKARVRAIWRGSLMQKAILEAREEDRWHFVSETGLIFFPFWKRPREVVMENPNLLTDH